MARGKKTGGRNFARGNKGKPKGAKDIVPRGFKRSIKALYERLADEQPALFEQALVKGLKARAPFSFQYLQMGAHYLDGKPAETVKFQPDLSKLTDEQLDQFERLMSVVHS